MVRARWHDIEPRSARSRWKNGSRCLLEPAANSSRADRRSNYASVKKGGTAGWSSSLHWKLINEPLEGPQ